MTTDLVLARFNEETAWTSFIREDVSRFVYNKGDGDEPRLHNAGREAHTYFNHIIVNYEFLADWTFFTQANPLDHCPNFVGIVNKWPDSYLKSAFYTVGGPSFFSSEPVRFLEDSPSGDDAQNDVKGLWNELFESDLDDHPVFTPGAIFAITRERLLSRSLEFYWKAAYLAVSRPRGPWEFERLWAYLWTSSAATKL